MTTFQIQHPQSSPVANGGGVRRSLTEGELLDRPHLPHTPDPHPDADDPDPDPDADADAIRIILPLLTDHTCTLFELCHLTGLSLSRLADLLESDRVTTALNDMQRALAVRRRAVDLHAPFAADAALLNLASTTPLDAREAEPVRKAAARLKKPAPAPPRPQAKARCRASTVRGEAPRTPQPPPPGAVLRPSAAKHAAHPNPPTPPTPPTSHTPTAPPPSAPRPCPDPSGPAPPPRNPTAPRPPETPTPSCRMNTMTHGAEERHPPNQGAAMRSFTPHRAPLTAFLLAGLPAAAFAAPAAVLDRVPPDTEIVIGIDNLGDFLADIDQVNRLLGRQAQPEMMFVTSMIRGTPGVNLDASAAIVIDLPVDPAAGEDPTAVALVPVTDFAAFTQQREPENGLVLMPFPDSEVYARDIGGGHAVLSDNPDAARAFDSTKGNLKQHAARLGAAGARVTDNAEVTVLFNADAMRPYLDQAAAGLQQQGEMVAMMGGEQAAFAFNTFTAIATAAASDLSAAALGMTINDTGLSYDMAMQFKEGSKSASYFSPGGGTAGLIDHLPAGPYMFAMSADTSAPTVANLANAVTAWSETLPDDLKAHMNMNFGQISLKDFTELTEGVAFVLGATPSLMGGGLFANASQFIKTDNPDAYRQAFLSTLNQADAQADAQADDQPAQALTIDTTVSPNAVTIEGADLTAYAISFKVNPQAAQDAGQAMPGMDPAMVMQMVFGPTAGPSGYIGKIESNIIQTLSQGPELTRKAIEAARTGEGLGASERIERVQAALPESRIAEVYIGIDDVLNAVGPMLMMFGALPEFQPVPAMDPIAMALTAEQGGFAGRLHIPAATLQAIAAIVPSDQAAQDSDDEQTEEGFDF